MYKVKVKKNYIIKLVVIMKYEYLRDERKKKLKSFVYKNNFHH